MYGLEAVRNALRDSGATQRGFRVELKNGQGQARVKIEKTVYIATKACYKAKLARNGGG